VSGLCTYGFGVWINITCPAFMNYAKLAAWQRRVVVPRSKFPLPRSVPNQVQALGAPARLRIIELSARSATILTGVRV